jgi:ABC-2 type transport system ATP-binding protein
LSVAHPKPAQAVLELVKWVDACGAGLDDIHIRRPTLEDVFTQLTGQKLRD